MEIVAQLRPYRRWADRRLRELAAAEPDTPAGQRAQLHARVALVGADDKLVAPLQEALLSAPSGQLGLLREALAQHKSAVTPQLWRTLHDSSATVDRRFRAGLALATYHPIAREWRPDDWRLLAEQLVAANPEHQPTLRGYLRPVAPLLLGDLERLFADQALSQSQQINAANAVADLAGDDPDRAARLLAIATPEQFQILFPLVADSAGSELAKSLEPILQQQVDDETGFAERLALGQRRAGAAITRLRIGGREEVLAALRATDNPETPTQFIHRCRARGVTPSELLACLQAADSLRQSKTGIDRQRENYVIYALLLALGEFALDELPPTERHPTINMLVRWYEHDPSAAIHAANGWLLRRWNQHEVAQRVDQTESAYDETGLREWFTLCVRWHREAELGTLAGGVEKKFYMTFVVFPAGSYEVGSPDDEPERVDNERRHAVTFERPIAILDREITWAEIEAFEPGFQQMRSQTAVTARVTPEFVSVGATWYDAVQYCRWLTERAGMSEMDQAYADPSTLDPERFPLDTDPRVGSAPLNWPVDLEKPGFRLPTEAEWEIASRGGMRTTFGFGDDVTLLKHYGWFVENSDKRLHLPRELRPNARGLFDMHGSVWEWCHDWYAGDATGTPLGMDPGEISRSLYRVNRGGGWYYSAAGCRCARRNGGQPPLRANDVGFRLVLVPRTSSPITLSQ